METTTSQFMRAEAATIFALAADTPNWPAILPHYRSVQVLDQAVGGERRTVAMSAHRDGIPVRWVAEQFCYPGDNRIEFLHTGGITRGMRVTWTMESRAGGTLVSIWHEFRPGWPLVPDALIHLIVGRFFVDTIARKTLGRIRSLAESQTVSR